MSDNMLAYYAHCVAIYNTPQEQRDIETLLALGWGILNPNCPDCDHGYKAVGMKFFETWPFENGATCIAFRALPDGSIPAGVAKEIELFKAKNLPVIELPSAVGRRTLSVDNTREYMREVGAR